MGIFRAAAIAMDAPISAARRMLDRANKVKSVVQAPTGWGLDKGMNQMLLRAEGEIGDLIGAPVIASRMSPLDHIGKLLFSNNERVKEAIKTAAWKGTLGSIGGRVGIGAVVGGLYGGLTSESNLAKNTFGDTIAGALTGAGIGFGVSVLPSVAKWAISERGVQAINKAVVGMGYPALRGAKNVGQGVLNFILNYPSISIAAGLGGLGLYGLASSGYGQTNASTRAMSAMAIQRGTNSALPMSQGANYIQSTPGYRPAKYRMLEESTNGLVQGLHHGRHR